MGVVLILCLVVLVLLIARWVKERYGLFGHIPGPLELPFLYSAIEVNYNEDRIYDWFLELSKKCGHVFTVAIPGFPRMIVVSDPPSLTHVLATNFQNYPKGVGMRSLLNPLFGNGIFAADGHDWELQRKIASHMFKASSIRAMAPVFEAHGHDVLAFLEQHKGQTVDTQHLFSTFTLESFAEIAFGEKFDGRSTHKSFAAAFNDATRATDLRFLIPFARWLPFLPSERMLRSSLKILNPIVLQLVQRRRDDPKRNGREDLLSLYLTMCGEDGKPFTNAEMRDFILNFIIAGRDTTAQALTWLFYLISTNPEAEKKILAEVDETLHGAAPNSESVKNMKYLKAAIDETLRLYPPVPLDLKQAEADDVLPSGHRIPAGTVIMWPAWVLGRHPDFWDRPLEFRPERWFGENGGKKVPAFQAPPFIPFQYGPRTCLGLNMAILEIKVMAVLVLQRYRLRHLPGRLPKPRRAITLSVADGMLMTVEPRAV